MPLPVPLLLIAIFLPLVGCIALLVLGRRVGTQLSGYIAIAVLCVALACTGWGMLRWSLGGNYYGQPFGKGNAPLVLSWRWLPLAEGSGARALEQDHPGWLDFVLYFDSLSVSLFLTVTLTSLLIAVFSFRSLRRDPASPRFFSTLLLMLFSTLALLSSGTLLQMLLMLETVAFAATLLTGFRVDNAVPARGGEKMFVLGRLGTAAMVLGLGIILAQVGNVALADLWMMLGFGGAAQPVVLPDGRTFPAGLLSLAGELLFFGAAVRCAQFPLQLWAMELAESIAPVIAAIFAAGTPLCGMFFIARIFPLLTPSARLLVGMIGGITVLMAALLAVVQEDLKRVLACISVAQLGYMCLAVGVGSWGGAMFHLVAWLFFQTLLFLSAGTVIRVARGRTQLSELGGLFRPIPVTAVTSFVGVLAVCGAGWGTIGLSGCFSRGLILRHVGAFCSLASELHRGGGYWLLFIVGIMALPLISFAAMRWWLMIFAGRPHDGKNYEHAREVSMLFWPMVILAILTALAGNWLGVREMLESTISESRQAVQIQQQASSHHYGSPAYVFSAAWSDADQGDDDAAPAPLASSVHSTALLAGERLSNQWGGPLTVLGLLAACVFCLSPGRRVAQRLAQTPPLNWIRDWLISGMYFRELSDMLVVSIVIGIAESVHRLDRAMTEWPSRWLSRRIDTRPQSTKGGSNSENVVETPSEG